MTGDVVDSAADAFVMSFFEGDEDEESRAAFADVDGALAAFTGGFLEAGERLVLPLAGRCFLADVVAALGRCCRSATDNRLFGPIPLQL